MGTDLSTGSADAGGWVAASAVGTGGSASNRPGFMTRASGMLYTAAKRCVGLIAVGVLLGGCGNIEPWVKPYERQAFADPIMAMDANPVSSSYIDHVYEARESARGAVGSSGGGCGCN